MNTIPPENQNKDTILKSLAVGGFIGLIIVIAWLGIQLVHVLPTAFTSLASIADTVYNYEEVTIDITKSTEVANVGESFSLSWQVPKTPGDFMFSYTCTDGVAVDLRTVGSAIAPVTCGQPYRLGNVSGVDVSVSAEKNRFTDIPYTISFVPRGAESAVTTTAGTITVVNASISTPPVATIPDIPTATPPTEPVTTPPPVTPVTTPTKPVVKPKPTTKPITTQTYSYVIPVSNPNGFTDLAATMSRIGTISNGTFLSNGVIDNDTSAALLFEIKNTGTKTSDTFTYTVLLPNGTSYTSPTQVALKPNERARIALGFDVGDIIGTKSFSVSVGNAGESNLGNNGFTGSVTIVD